MRRGSGAPAADPAPHHVQAANLLRLGRAMGTIVRLDGLQKESFRFLNGSTGRVVGWRQGPEGRDQVTVFTDADGQGQVYAVRPATVIPVDDPEVAKRVDRALQKLLKPAVNEPWRAQALFNGHILPCLLPGDPTSCERKAWYAALWANVLLVLVLHLGIGNDALERAAAVALSPQRVRPAAGVGIHIPLENSTDDPLKKADAATSFVYHQAIAEAQALHGTHRALLREHERLKELENVFYTLDPAMLGRPVGHDPSECRWLPTGGCTPYGMVDDKSSRSCRDAVESPDAGYCACGRAKLALGKPCGMRRQVTFTCESVCSLASAQPPTSHHPSKHVLSALFPVDPRDARPAESRSTGFTAAFVYLYKPADSSALVASVASVERAGNQKMGYPYVLIKTPVAQELNTGPDVSTALAPIVADRRRVVAATVSGTRWYPGLAEQAGNSLGTPQSRYTLLHLPFHPALRQFDFIWRLEPQAILPCPFSFDPFVLMHAKGKKLGFTVVERTRSNVTAFATANRDAPPADAALWRSLCDGGDENPGTFCEIDFGSAVVSLAWARSDAYQSRAQQLERAKGFLRVGVHVPHTLLAAGLLKKAEVQYMEGIALAGPHSHTPADREVCRGWPVPVPALESPCVAVLAALSDVS
ncbi:O-glycoside alpha-1 [Diplonema papillatum]|nr:O-glycoside alpha-1 [Diplonema papillatum]